MELAAFESVLKAGEGISIEFKRCGNQPAADTFETVCSFANRQGGSIYLGVLDNGTVEGVPVASVKAITRNVANAIANPHLFDPSPSVEFETIEFDGRAVIRIWVPSGETVYRYKGEYYDRVADSDVRVKSADQISLMFIRKQNRFSEQRIYPYLTEADLRLDLIQRAREMALARNPSHPWGKLDNAGLLRSARLHLRDRETGTEGYTLAALMLFGTDDAILDVCPAYRTDAVARFELEDRYDDRAVIQTNLLDAYDALVAFARRNSPDRFLLEGDVNVSARDIIVRELVANSLMHREYSSPMPAKLIVGPSSIKTENASKSTFVGAVTLASFNPIPKNPAIAHAFAQIGLAEELGSGVRNLEKYSAVYSGKPPALEDGDVFKAEVFLPGHGAENSDGPAMAFEEAVRSLAAHGHSFTARDVAVKTGCSLRTAQRHLKALIDEGELSAHKEAGRLVYSN